MTDFIDTVFRLAGRADHAPCADCPDDDTLAAYQDAALSATERRAVQDHALACAHAQLMLASLAEQRAATERTPGLRIVARLAEKGLALLNAAELTLRELAGQPALGALRGDDTCPLLRLAGPGRGLDEIELQAQSDGSIRCSVSGELADRQDGELSSVVLEVDGVLREKRPFSGERLAFSPLTGGSCRIALITRRPGEAAREVSAAVLDLVA